MSADPNAVPHYPLVESAIEAIADWVNRFRDRTGRSGLGECDSQEVARIAADLGISSRELHALAEAKPGSAALLQEMLPALGIDAKALAETDPLVMRDLQRLCVTCRTKGTCRHALDDLTAEEHYREFCPNAVTLDALVKQRSA